MKGPLDRGDVAVAILLAAGTIVYLVVMPWSLGASDEGYYLYHAVRVLGGETLYRDISELITPLYIDLMALLFRTFGAAMATARLAAAAIQAGIMALIYLTCRAVGVRRGLAVAAALPHMAIGQPAWPYATPHWLGTLLVSLLLLIGLDRQRARRTGWTVVQGLLLGLVIVNRQQTGVVMGAALAVLVAADRLADRRWRGAPGLSSLRQLALLAVGAAAIVIPILGVHVARAGVRPLVQQLVVQPLTGYRAVNRIAWGAVGFLSNTLALYTYAPLLQYFPLIVLPIGLLRAGIAWRPVRDRAYAERLLALCVFGVFSAVSILYFPDFIHITFIMPVVLVLAAEMLESLLRRGAPWTGRVGAVLITLLLAACGLQMAYNLRRARAEFPFVHETAFGRIALGSQREVVGVDRIRRLLDNVPGRELFIYPGFAAAYLLVGAHNPTRHDLIFPKYQSAEEIEGVIEALERRRPRYIALLRFAVQKDDPIGVYVARHYHCDDDGLCVRTDDPTGE